MASLDLPTFITCWQAATLTEKSGAQQHFIDLCRLLGQKTPAEADPTGAAYAFEKGAQKSSGGGGWADVWKRGSFAWEYKGKHKDLKAAYQQLLQYREDLCPTGRINGMRARPLDERAPALVRCTLKAASTWVASYRRR